MKVIAIVSVCIPACLLFGVQYWTARAGPPPNLYTWWAGRCYSHRRAGRAVTERGVARVPQLPRTHAAVAPRAVLRGVTVLRCRVVRCGGY